MKNMGLLNIVLVLFVTMLCVMMTSAAPAPVPHPNPNPQWLAYGYPVSYSYGYWPAYGKLFLIILSFINLKKLTALKIINIYHNIYIYTYQTQSTLNSNYVAACFAIF
ncbi:unnamed protein product [Diabrotica balteata]|uniref:Uncharacterized protein n=1 Tax=Diabrotica balteata TaxID=107213 RepID=A0A9P0E000_DIABA|nr:unnamed protein product [Diabrotica balteata]